MLDKNDIKQIKNVVGESLSEFLDEALAPYLERKFKENDEAHKDIVARFDENDKDHDKMFRAMEKNTNEHEDIFVKQAEIDKTLRTHDKRLKQLEATVVAS